MHVQHTRPAERSTRGSPGFSLIELMVAMALGLLLVIAIGYVYLSSKTAFTRQQQLSSMQQNVRVAFEYLTSDVRVVGHMGCATGKTAVNSLSTTPPHIDTNYLLGIEGYEYTNATAGTYTLSSDNPANSTTASSWATNVATNGVNTIPISTIAGSGTTDGLTPGSDVLVIRTVNGEPARLTADATPPATTLSIENKSSGKCSDDTTNKVSGLCRNSHALIASCAAAQVFSVSGSPVGSAVTMSGALAGTNVYAHGVAQVFPMQTIVYYVKRPPGGLSTSLYRRIFDGHHAGGLEQELIEGVESLQIRYGRDTSTPPDQAIDDYVTAQNVGDWSTVIAVRVSLLMRSTAAVSPDIAVPASAPVNGVTVTFPSNGTKYDRRVFTTTIAVRNKI
jgi:type IV pilus assembly protein PilW